MCHDKYVCVAKCLRSSSIIIPACFVKVGPHVFAGALAAVMNMSDNSLVVQRQWSNSNIIKVAKFSAPKTPTDFRPISITSVLFWILEMIVLQNVICRCRKKISLVLSQYRIQRSPWKTRWRMKSTHSEMPQFIYKSE